MTAVEAYDVAAEWWGSRACAVQMGDRCIVGAWIAAGEVSGSEERPRVLRSPVWMVEAWGEGDSWAAAVDAARTRRST